VPLNNLTEDPMRVLREARIVAAALAGVAFSIGPPVARASAAQSLVCFNPDAYPGDDAPKAAIAAWMASRAEAEGLPAELPVMAALVESGLRNRQPSGGSAGDADSVGFFQMRVGTWNHGPYAGYPDKPELQVKWFLDSADAVRLHEMARGRERFGENPAKWGRWAAAAVGAPPGHDDRYQRRLEKARELIAAGRAGGSCTFEGDYPGNDAPTAILAAWLAARAAAAGLPPELPVMASLVESGVKNLNFGDADSVGFFKMRLSIWNSGPYAGFLENPELQIKWFIDQAIRVRELRIAAGDASFGNDPNQFGEWIADVERPAEQFRGRYQLRLDEARALIRSACEM
jgi:hypothetical protein